MSSNMLKRRNFIKSLIGGFSAVAFDWSAFPVGSGAKMSEDQFDAIIIGSGLGGLSCAAAFARQGFKPLVLEQHNKPGGYATTFKRKGFEFDASLHSTTVDERNGVYNLIDGFPEITDIEFVPHSDLYRVVLPDYDIRVPQKNLQSYIDMLVGYFPEEQAGIKGIFEDMQGLLNDVRKISKAGGKIDMSRFAVDFPFLVKSADKTWGAMVDARIKNPKLKAIVSSLWVYFGLPPSKLSPFYYALPTLGYLSQGGYYPIGKSQKISDALVKFIEERGGKVMLKTRVREILVKDHAAYGVKTDEGAEFQAKVVVSNACAHDTFQKMMNETEILKDYLQKLENYSVSLSGFQVFLGLKTDLISKIGIKDTEIFHYPGYDIDAIYAAMVNADLKNGGYAVTLYDNLYQGYSPSGKNTLNIMTLMGYDHWKKYEADYFNGNKSAYRAEKERMADTLIEKAEQALLPGLREAIEVKEIGSPLTHLRYTSNYRGAIYGWDQTLDNSSQNRLPHKTPIKNLYLAGAWTSPGHGYGAVIPSGLQCFTEIIKEW